MLPLRYVELSLLFLITWRLTSVKTQNLCPIDFKIAYTKYYTDKDNMWGLCYRRKGPESFNDKFIECPGNLYTVELYNKLNITETSTTLWTDYKSQYGAGPFIDWSHTSSTGKLFDASKKVTIDSGFFEKDELCMVIDPVSNFTAAKCDELHYRYCFIRPNVKQDFNIMPDEEFKFKAYILHPWFKGRRMKSIAMQVSVDKENKIILSVNDTIDDDDVFCVTDSETYYPTKVETQHDNDSNVFVLKPIGDGYYWCTHRDTEHFRISESNKALYIKEKHNLMNNFAARLRCKTCEAEQFDRLKANITFWKEHISLRVCRADPKNFAPTKQGCGALVRGVNINLKRYLEPKSVLLHIQLPPEMQRMESGTWDNLKGLPIKPVYYCNDLDTNFMTPLGSSMTKDCILYRCVGDFNWGVQWETSAIDNCISTPVISQSTDYNLNEQLQQVIDHLEALQNYTIPVTFDKIEQTLTQIDKLLGVKEHIKIPGNLLHQLDRLGAKLDLNGSHQASAIRPNIALLVADAEPDVPIWGLRIASRNDEQFTDDAFDIITDQINSTLLTANASEAVVHLPLSVATSSRRISFVVFRNDRAFPSEHGHYSVNSRVLSINVENLTEFRSGEVIDIHLKPVFEDLGRSQSRSCAYWHFNKDGSGFWSQEGCTFIKSNADGILDTCRCDHLTHFAEVLVRTTFLEQNENALKLLTIIGCCLSIFGLSMVGLTAALFRSWRRDFTNKVWLQLCIAILLLVLCFLIVIFARFHSHDIPCMLLGVVLHYSVLASFCWMLVAAELSYRRLVIVFARDVTHKLLRASAFAWGAPCAVVGILLSVDRQSYAGRFEEKTPSGAFCYPSGLGLWLAVYAPIAITLLANWTLFALIVRSVFASRRIQRHGDTNEAVRCASVSCLLVFLFGLPWLFGLFAYNVVAAYMFTLTATYQGFVLFLFFVLGNKNTRDLWLKKLLIKQTRKKLLTSSTYIHKSIATRADPEGASIMGRNSPKPRSLASSDNLRFS